MAAELMESIRTERYDIVVIGGGPSGMCAAIAAARKKKNVLLVEKYGFLGGMATAAMMTPWQGFFASGKKIVGGIADEIVARLQQENGSPGHIHDRGKYFTPFDSEVLKFVLQEMAVESGVHLLLHAEYIDCSVRGPVIENIRLHCREGMVIIQAPLFIDATGVGTVAVSAGVPSHTTHSPASYRFSMTNVDVSELLKFVSDNAREFSSVLISAEGHFLLDGFHSLAREWSAAHAELYPAPSVEIASDMIPGNVVVSIIRIPDVDPSVIESMSGAGILTQTHPSIASAFLKEHLPGFSAARVLVTPPQPGLHAVRRVDGIIPITFAKIMSGESYYDSAGLFSLPGETPERFQVSQRSMRIYKVQNLFVTGRAILPQSALYSTNNQPASMKLGEEAGLMAARML
jgi:ribulose 1,5-bisphosphate synthetase/thiazole synthase